MNEQAQPNYKGLSLHRAGEVNQGLWCEVTVKAFPNRHANFPKLHQVYYCARIYAVFRAKKM